MDDNKLRKLERIMRIEKTRSWMNSRGQRGSKKLKEMAVESARFDILMRGFSQAESPHRELAASILMASPSKSDLDSYKSISNELIDEPDLFQQKNSSAHPP